MISIKKIIFVTVTSFLFAFAAQPAFATQIDPSIITPTVYCLGNCPTLPAGGTPTSMPTGTNSTTTPAPSTSTAPTTTNPSPTIDPCATESSASIMTNNKKKKKFRNGNEGGFIEKFLQFLLKLILELLRLIGGQPPTTPGQLTPTPTSGQTSPTPDVTPSVSPCASPTEPAGNGTTTPSQPVTVVPSGTVLSPTLPANASCTNPAWTSSDPNGMWETNGFFIHNNMWNNSAGPQTTYACAYNNWYSVSTQTNDAGAVRTYPNVHKDFNQPLNSFTTITSSYAHTAPAVSNGIWNFAYDVWLNGLDIEVMIWTDNMNQVPSGDNVGTRTFGGRTYEVWRTSGNNYFAFVQQPSQASGSVNIREMLDYLIAQGWLSANVELYQIGYGVEVVSTNGAPATFRFTNFSLTAN